MAGGVSLMAAEDVARFRLQQFEADQRSHLASPAAEAS
jgi:hypothetical protein